MQFITTKTPTTLTALTHQVFTIHGAKSAAATKQARAALREANPHWGNATKLPAGTLVIVPEVPGVTATAPSPATVMSPAVVAQLQQVLADAKKVLERSLITAMREMKISVALARSRDLIALAKQMPELQTRLSQTVEQSKLQLKEMEVARTEQLQGLAQLEKDLASLNR